MGDELNVVDQMLSCPCICNTCTLGCLILCNKIGSSTGTSNSYEEMTHQGYTIGALTFQ
jgi:hypothetical protein